MKKQENKEMFMKKQEKEKGDKGEKDLKIRVIFRLI